MMFEGIVQSGWRLETIKGNAWSSQLQSSPLLAQARGAFTPSMLECSFALTGLYAAHADTMLDASDNFRHVASTGHKNLHVWYRCIGPD